MGMFDDVKISYPIPGLQGKSFLGPWQTKDLECNLHTYEIKETGELWMIKSSFDEDFKPEKADHTGDLWLLNDDVDDNWFTYVANFESGILLEIERCDF